MKNKDIKYFEGCFREKPKKKKDISGVELYQDSDVILMWIGYQIGCMYKQMQLDKLTTNRRNLREENTELLNEIDCLILEVNDLKKQIKRMQHG